MSRHDEAHSACLNILHDHPESAYRITELCTFARSLGDEIDTLRAQLAACAAGPWRDDVENIEDDEFYLCEYPERFQALSGFVIKLDSKPFRGCFAAINPPEVKP